MFGILRIYSYPHSGVDAERYGPDAYVFSNTWGFAEKRFWIVRRIGHVLLINEIHWARYLRSVLVHVGLLLLRRRHLSHRGQLTNRVAALGQLVFSPRGSKTAAEALVRNMCFHFEWIPKLTVPRRPCLLKRKMCVDNCCCVKGLWCARRPSADAAPPPPVLPPVPPPPDGPQAPQGKRRRGT